ncbi:MAG TPA: ribosome silencing factor [Moheibacter sp.]|nr:ribosome silencing factor [Moheibacter sp.]
MSNKVDSKTLIDTIVDSILDLKGEEIVLLDLREIENAFCEYFIVCTGNSNTHVSSIAGAIERKVRKETKEKPWHVEGTENAQWILLDYTNIIVHVFQKQYREYYDIESLWGDAKEISITI